MFGCENIKEKVFNDGNFHLTGMLKETSLDDKKKSDEVLSGPFQKFFDESASCDKTNFNEDLNPPSQWMGVFNDFYSKKLQEVANSSANQVDVLERRGEILQSYVTDLKFQNEFLTDTLEELEKQTKDRVELLEANLLKTANASKDYLDKVCHYEQELSILKQQNSKEHQYIQHLETEVKSKLNESLNIHDQNANLKRDIQSLISIIRNARHTGTWQIDNVTFCEDGFKDVYGGSTTPSSCDSLGNENDCSPTKKQLMGNHRSTFKNDLDFRNFDTMPLQQSQSHVNDVNNSTSIASKEEQDILLMKFKMDLHHSAVTNQQLHNGLLERHRIIAELESQITDLRHQIILKDTQLDHFHQNIQNLQHNYNILLVQLKHGSSRKKDHNGLVLLNQKPLHGEVSCQYLTDVGINMSSKINNAEVSSGEFTQSPISSPNSLINSWRRGEITEVDDSGIVDDCFMTIQRNLMDLLQKSLSKGDIVNCGEHIDIGTILREVENIMQIALKPMVENELKIAQDNIQSSLESATHFIAKVEEQQKEPIRKESCNCLCTCNNCGISSPECSTSTDCLERRMPVQMSDEVIESSVSLSSGEKCRQASMTTTMLDLLADVGETQLPNGILEQPSNESQKIDLATRMKNVEGQLLKAKQEEESKTVLLEQLKNHLKTAFTELQLKNTALFNLETKLDKARLANQNNERDLVLTKSQLQQSDECISLLQQQIQEKDQEISKQRENEANILNQKHSLIYQLDERGSQLLATEQDNSLLAKKLEERQLQAENLVLTIQNLQDAIIEEKKNMENLKRQIQQKVSPLSSSATTSSLSANHRNQSIVQHI